MVQSEKDWMMQYIIEYFDDMLCILSNELVADGK
jgi:hypothetical protein